LFKIIKSLYNNKGKTIFVIKELLQYAIAYIIQLISKKYFLVW